MDNQAGDKFVNLSAAAILLLVAFNMGVLGILADLIGANRQLIEETLFSARRQMYKKESQT